MCSDPTQTIFAVLSVALPLIIAVWQGWIHRHGLGQPSAAVHEVGADLHVQTGAREPGRVATEGMALEERLEVLERRVDGLGQALAEERQERRWGDVRTLERAREATGEVAARIARHEGGHRADEHQEHRHGLLVAAFSATAGISALFNVAGSYVCQ